MKIDIKEEVEHIETNDDVCSDKEEIVLEATRRIVTLKTGRTMFWGLEKRETMPSCGIPCVSLKLMCWKVYGVRKFKLPFDKPLVLLFFRYGQARKA